MAKSLLDQLSEMTVVVADTGDIQSIRRFRPRDATTNPSLITAAAQMPEYAPIVDEALLWSRREAGANAPKEAVIKKAVDRLAVEFGLRILAIVAGRVSTEVDARLSFDTRRPSRRRTDHQAVRGGRGDARARAHQDRVHVGRYSRGGDPRKGGDPLQSHAPLRDAPGRRVRGGEGDADLAVRRADPRLVQEGRRGGSMPPRRIPGVLSVTRIYRYFKRHGHKTEVMGASFRNLGRDHRARGVRPAHDRAEAPVELSSKGGELARRLDPKASAALGEDRIAMNEATFRKMHDADRMAKEKLDEGIAGLPRRSSRSRSSCRSDSTYSPGR